MNPLEGRNALVTGGGSGIGRAIARTLAERGARVWIGDLDAGAADETAKAIRGRGAELDVTQRESLAKLRERIFAEDGRLDILVANAGVSTMNHFLELSDEEWDHNFAVNARGTFLTLQTFARAMVEQDSIANSELRGKIVATASMAARQAAPLLAHYSASKFAVVGLVQSVAKELAPRRVSVNAVNPGFVATAMQEREVAWEAKLRGVSPERVIDDYVGATPLGRLQRPEDVAHAVAFLAAGDSDFMTGEVLEVNGGAYMA